MDAPVVIKDPNDNQRLIAHYSRVKPEFEVVERGVVLFNDKKEVFEKNKEYDLKRNWERLGGHVTKHKEGQTEYLYAGSFSIVRVKADLNKIIDQNEYEALTCLKPGTKYTAKTSILNRDSNGQLLYQWHRKTVPVSPIQERRLLKFGLIKSSEARFHPRSVDTDETPLLASGSIDWNPYRKKWIIIAAESGGG